MANNKSEKNTGKPQKGVAGENTGGKARKAIKKAKARSATNTSIGKAVNRDPDTIRQIESGRIENPPADLAGNVAKARSVKKDEEKADMTGIRHMSFEESMKIASRRGK